MQSGPRPFRHHPGNARRWWAFVAAPVLMALIGLLTLWHGPIPQADFTYVLSDSVRTLDPASMSWANDIRIALGLWEGLASFHPVTIEPIDGVAFIPPNISDDGLTYTFQLRRDARWSNGDPVIAADFIYGWRRAIEPGTAADYAFLITENIAGAADYAAWRNQAVRTLGLLRRLRHGENLDAPDQAFLNALDLPGAAAERLDWRAIADEYRRAHLAAMDDRFAEVGLEALDDYRLRVQLARPVSYFLDLLAFSTFLPIHRSIELLRERDDPIVADQTLWVFDPQWVKSDYHRHGYPGLVTNGAFRLAAWQFKRYMLFEANEHYWDRANVRSESIMARIITEGNTAFLAYEQGEVDWLNDVARLDFAPALVAEAQAHRRDDIHMTPAFGAYFYNFNCLERLPDGRENPFVDARLRMAFTLAVDKQAIVERVTRLGQLPAYNFIPPGSIPGYYCPPGPSYDPGRARALLAEAGYPDGRGLPPIEILYNTGHGHEIPAQAVAEMWRQNLGVAVTLIGKEVKSFAEDKQSHRFMVCRAGWFGDYADPTTFLDMLVTDNGNNDSAFSNARYDALVAAAAASRDPEERMALLAEAETIIVSDQMPIMPLYYYVNLMAFRPNVVGIHPNPRSMYMFKYLGR